MLCLVPNVREDFKAFGTSIKISTLTAVKEVQGTTFGKTLQEKLQKALGCNERRQKR